MERKRKGEKARGHCDTVEGAIEEDSGLCNDVDVEDVEDVERTQGRSGSAWTIQQGGWREIVVSMLLFII